MGFTSSLFGSKPKVPKFVPVDASAEQINAARGNLGVLPTATQLGSEVNTYSQSELDRMYSIALPGYESIRKNIGENLTALSSGILPQDVQDMIGRSNAAKALGKGIAGSGMHKYLNLRDLGIASLEAIGKAQSATERWLQTATAPRFDITSMFLSAPQRVAHAVGERNTKFQRDWLAAQVKAAPDPGVVGWWNTAWDVVNVAMSAYTGSETDFGQVNPQGSFAGFQSGDMGMAGGADAYGDFGSSFGGDSGFYV